MPPPDRTEQTAALIENPGPNGRIIIRHDIPIGKPGKNEVLVKLTHSGICGSEVRAVSGWGNYNPIIGHEGIGIIVQTGDTDTDTDIALQGNPDPLLPLEVGTRVGVKWLYRACGHCSLCRRGDAHNCPTQDNTGRTVPGTLQQYVVADRRYLTRIPERLPSEVAAPLLCAGLTVAGALAKLEQDLRAGDWLVVSGAGGGLGHIGVQVAARLYRLRVIAIDAGPEKRALSLSSGAEVFFDYMEEEDVEARVKALTGEGAHGIMVVPGTKEAFQMAPKLVRNMGVIVCVGLPPLDLDFPISATVCAARGLTIKGSSVGTEKQMVELLEHAVTGQIKPEIDVLEFSQVHDVVQRLKNGTITGRVVVKIPE